MARVLLVDDDAELCAMLAEYLQPEGFVTTSVQEGETALERISSETFDAVVLDVMLPGLSGFDVLRRVRETSRVPVVMLTARGQDVDRIVGLEMGADDYLPKPFNPRELVARLRAVLRRAQAPAGDVPDKLVIGDVTLDPGNRSVLRAGTPVTLTSTEFSVLEVLLRHAGRVVGKDELSREALGRELGRYDRSLDMHISNLRRKLGPTASATERIQTVRGVGYQYLRA
jgi:two-component system response regulator CpxR